MRSMPAMTDMKKSAAEMSGEAQSIVMPNVSDLPEYDYGLCGSFNKDSLDKLDLDDEVSAGDYLDIRALAKVTSIHMKPGSNEIDRVDFCMCHIAVENEDEDDEETEDGAA